MVTNEYSCWQTPPLDIMENILQRVNLGDRIRLRNSCKYWKSIVMRRDIPGAPHELPWLLLPQAPKCSNKCLSFASLTERKEVKLKLPKEVRGSWIYGSWKGWLIMVKEKGLQSTMCLLNPISGALHKLPPLRTIPSFKKIVKTRQWKRFGASTFLWYVALLTPHDLNSSGHFTVAIIFEDFKGQKTLGLCKLEDLTWSLFRVFDNKDRLELVDILFSRGILYALVDSQKDGLVAATRVLNFADHGVKLKLIHDKQEHKNVRIDDLNSDYPRVSNANYRSMLLESTSNEVLVIHQMVDYVLCRDGAGDINDIEEDDGNIIVDNQEGVDQDNDGDEGNHENDHEESNLEANNQDGGEIDDVEYVIDEDAPGFNPHVTTRSFRVYKIDPNNNNLLPVQNLGDQVFFLGDGAGSVSLPSGNFPEVKRNCIYFATNYVWNEELSPKTYRSREIGIFYLDGERIRRPFSSVKILLSYRATWFTPSL
ncbi:putative F-box domain-containing protein [Rosa chinensis]|uniref:Putative F-box domain-containing protein n=1 Tax=Rosa chinensis TaxID=74649 RepID=A0A2P6PLL7_ROSCH|nr:putative F-box domain-containing protein [Rosa chinensis]